MVHIYFSQIGIVVLVRLRKMMKSMLRGLKTRLEERSWVKLVTIPAAYLSHHEVRPCYHT